MKHTNAVERFWQSNTSIPYKAASWPTTTDRPKLKVYPWTASASLGLSTQRQAQPIATFRCGSSFSQLISATPRVLREILVRLCAKTEVVSSGEGSGVAHDRELAYCNVKLFRDHGAERKLSNDVERVRKSIDKLEQQVSRADMAGRLVKRKHGSIPSAATKGNYRQMKQPKQKRKFSTESDDKAPEKLSLEDDIPSNL